REVARYLRRQRQERRQFAVRHTFDDLAGHAPAFVQVRAAALHYAQTDATVLLTGETGTGKEWFAQAMHHASRRRSRPFVALNCAALPETLLEGELFGHEEGAFTGARRGGRPGVLEAANTGSLFLDEIGDMPLPLQTRLLRVIQEREVTRLGSARPIPLDIRILAATHQPLADLVAQGRFRADLYYRLNVLALTLPPLRDRLDDLAPIAVRQLAQALRRLGCELDAEALLAPFLPALRWHDWPGNLRELENIGERLAARACRWRSLDTVDFEELWHALPELTGARAGRGAVAPEANWRAVLQSCGNNRSEAARRLGISRSTLWRRMRAAPADAD
ncbi:MAG: sigma-54 interaction domain-containing protein, partial [Pigmentiphaga sp.]